jgi:hypothetical protein
MMHIPMIDWGPFFHNPASLESRIKSITHKNAMDRNQYLSFPLFFVFQPIGIMPPIAAHAEC